MDDALLTRARGGDRAAMEALLLEVTPSVERFIRRMCPGSDGDDVLQDTLVSLVTHLDDFEGRSAFTSWVFALTRSACTRNRRGLKNRPHDGDEAMSQLASPTPDPERAATDDELSAALSRALDTLSPEHREVIALRDIEGLTAPEAAEALGISVDALKSRLHRARVALRGALVPTLEASTPRPSPACPDIMALWSQRLEGDLSPDDCATMARHVHGCASCGPACKALERTLFACQQQRAPVVTPEMRARVRRALEAASAEAKAP